MRTHQPSPASASSVLQEVDMPKYEFLVSNGVPMPTNKAIRSHAIKTALQLCSNRVAGKDLPDGAADSARTAQRKKELKG